MKSFRFLLEPYSTEEFFREYWTKKAVLIAANNPQKWQGLFSWEQLNYLLNFHQLSSPDLRFSLDGNSLPDARPEQWRSRLEQGATLIINGVHQRVPELANLALAVREELGYRTQINLYCSPQQQKGFNCHYDTHEVLILQIDGIKEWLIFSETIPYPIAEMRSSDHLPHDTPYLHCILKPGDVLYIPRGHWHYAISASSPEDENYCPSLHLTLGIDCKIGLDWLHWLSEDLQNDPEWRQNLPLFSSLDQTQVQFKLEKLRDQLISHLKNSNTLERYLKHLNYCDRPHLSFSLPYQLGSKIFDKGLETRFICEQSLNVKIIKVSENYTQIIVGSQQVNLKNISSDLVEKMFRPQGFNLLDLAEWSPLLEIETEVIPLLTHLVSQGILFVESS